MGGIEKKTLEGSAISIEPGTHVTNYHQYHDTSSQYLSLSLRSLKLGAMEFLYRIMYVLSGLELKVNSKFTRELLGPRELTEALLTGPSLPSEGDLYSTKPSWCSSLRSTIPLCERKPSWNSRKMKKLRFVNPMDYMDKQGTYTLCEARVKGRRRTMDVCRTDSLHCPPSWAGNCNSIH